MSSTAVFPNFQPDMEYIDKIRVLSQEPDYVACMISGGKVACERAVDAAKEKNANRSTRLSVPEFVVAMCDEWKRKAPKKPSDGEKAAVSTVVVAGYENNAPTVWYAEVTHGSKPIYRCVTGTTFFSGSGKTISANVFRGYHENMEWPQIRNLVRLAMIESSVPYPPNHHNVKLVKCGGNIQVHLIHPNNTREVKLNTPLDDLKREA